MGAGTVGVCVLTWFAWLSWFDIRERRLPNWLTVPGALAILIWATATGRGAPALAGAVSLFAIYLAIHLVAPAAIGAGDVKLAIGIGALTGAFGVDVWSLAAVTAPLLTAGIAVVVRIVSAERTVPHGPSMCAAAAAATALVLL
ncbi:prepilin peptidase [Mycolicibacterium gadium]|jgi:leader peptidase (prepilin peptidase)/N-methyltransferase|uniref:Prepilin peptidase n=1 Tax=Mycolicibacterium gadium TaxID=1794 RepID=A0A7I7WH09_MYCGU|nr:A24 family peptidase [Mycolicibacterium gadium]BBZ16959.1 prepilin peptidase [Mycolicibacterium gadium]